jgi:hypothetical protein
VKDVPFAIATSGDPNLRLSFNNPTTSLSNQIIVSGRTTPIDFGSVVQNGTPATQTLTVANQGTTPLNLSSFTLPPGFSFVNTPPASVAANSTASLVIQLNSTTVGSQFGKISFTTNDPDVPVVSFNLLGVVTGTPQTGAPVITLPDAALGYNFKSLPRVFAPNATVTDSDSANFNTGNLKVEIASGANALDVLSIRNLGTGAGQIGINGSNLTYGGTTIGTFTGGSGGSPFVISFTTTAATPMAVQVLVRNLTFTNTSTTPNHERRYLRLTLTDNTGKVSNLAIANVSPSGLERAPTVATMTNSTVVINSVFSKSGSFSDPYGNTWTGTIDYGDGAGAQTLTLNADKTFNLSHTYALVGNFTITVTINSDTGGTKSTTFTVAVTSVSSIQINGGAAQRSRLTTIMVNFASSINASTLTGLAAITLTRTVATSSGTVGTVVQTGATGANGRILVSPPTGTTFSITLTFTNANGAATTAGVESGSLADGRWQLAIPLLNYQSTLIDPNLRRLFGDSNNDGTVDGTDFGQFGSVFGQTLANSPFDDNADATVDGTDFAQFGARFGVTL